MRLPGPVVDELQRWGDAQANPDSLRIVRIRTLTDVNGYAIVIRSQEVAEPAEELSSAQVGGKEYHVGQSMSPEEFEDFFKAILSENPGPVTIESEDNVTGAQVSTRVGDWADFTGGPATNKAAHESQVDDLTRTGYLAFEEVAPGKVQSKIPYQVLTQQYFRDFDRFLRCQEIPARYFQPVSAGPACFISHRWASPQHPDPSGSQFRLLKGFSERNDSKLIWYDYSCLPQPPLSVPEREAFRESIHYLNSLVMTAEFVSIVTGDYITRAWCDYEWVMSQLLTGGRRTQFREKHVEADFDHLVPELVIEGRRPPLAVTKNEDMPDIEELLRTGVDFFKLLAVRVTLRVLNGFGFSFGEGIAANLIRRIDFGQLWTIWQLLAGSSNHSGIRLSHLVDAKRLESILNDRHERFGTHTRIHGELGALSRTQLNPRVVEQDSSDRLLALMARARRAGPVPAEYTALALVKLVYALASNRGGGQP